MPVLGVSQCGAWIFIMNINRIMSFGSIFFALVLFGFGLLKYSAGQTRVGIYYLIGGLGFLIVFISYKSKQKSG